MIRILGRRLKEAGLILLGRRPAELRALDGREREIIETLANCYGEELRRVWDAGGKYHDFDEKIRIILWDYVTFDKTPREALFDPRHNDPLPFDEIPF